MYTYIYIWHRFANMKPTVEHHHLGTILWHFSIQIPRRIHDHRYEKSVSPRPVAAKETSIPHGRQYDDDIAKACRTITGIHVVLAISAND